MLLDKERARLLRSGLKMLSCMLCMWDMSSVAVEFALNEERSLNSGIFRSRPSRKHLYGHKLTEFWSRYSPNCILLLCTYVLWNSAEQKIRAKKVYSLLLVKRGILKADKKELRLFFFCLIMYFESKITMAQSFNTGVPCCK